MPYAWVAVKSRVTPVPSTFAAQRSPAMNMSLDPSGDQVTSRIDDPSSGAKTRRGSDPSAPTTHSEPAATSVFEGPRDQPSAVAGPDPSSSASRRAPVVSLLSTQSSAPA